MDSVVLVSGPGPLLLLLGLAVFSCVGASWNVTADYGVKRLMCSSPENCTDDITELQWKGHFYKCPEEYKFYCIKGRCRYVVAEQKPSCVICPTSTIDTSALVEDAHRWHNQQSIDTRKRCYQCGECVPTCETGYTGARCELVDIFYLRGNQGQIVVICLIVTMVALIILVICICTCSHHCRKRRRRRKEEEMETLEKNLPTKHEDVLETDIA